MLRFFLMSALTVQMDFLQSIVSVQTKSVELYVRRVAVLLVSNIYRSSLLFKFGLEAQSLECALHHFGQVDRVPLKSQSAACGPGLVFLLWEAFIGTVTNGFVLGVVCDPRDPQDPIRVEVVLS